MAKNTIAARRSKGKEGFRGKLTKHEIALLAELIELYGMRGTAARFA
jgi:hypothetical protein